MSDSFPKQYMSQRWSIAPWRQQRWISLSIFTGNDVDGHPSMQLVIFHVKYYFEVAMEHHNRPTNVLSLAWMPVQSVGWAALYACYVVMTLYIDTKNTSPFLAMLIVTTNSARWSRRTGDAERLRASFSNSRIIIRKAMMRGKASGGPFEKPKCTEPNSGWP